MASQTRGRAHPPMSFARVARVQTKNALSPNSSEEKFGKSAGRHALTGWLKLSKVERAEIERDARGGSRSR